MPESFAADNANQPNATSTQETFGNPDANANSTPTPGDDANKGAVTRDEVALLSKRLNDSQEYIKRLESERAEDRRQLQETAALLERLTTNEELKKLLQTPPDGKPKDRQEATVDPDAIVKQVLETVRNDSVARETAAKQQANFAQVSSALVERYGKEAVDAKVKEVAEQHNLTFAEAVTMAKNNPTVFLRLFPDVKAPPAGTPSSTRNSAALQTDADRQKQPPFWLRAKSTKDKVAAYTQALQELTNNQ